MKALIIISKTIAILGLVVILLISVLYAWDILPVESYRPLLILSSIVWFAGIILAGQIQKRRNSKH